jgi:hypothetical protein
MADSRRAVLTQYLLLAVIILVGAYLRLVNLRTNPGWYPDEGSNLNVAWNLWQGRFQYFAIGGSLLVNARAPLFPLILAGLFNLVGYDILIARVVCAVAGVVTIPLLFFALENSLGGWRALGAAASLAVFPLAVLYNRWAFDYNLLMPLSVICYWAFLRLIETRAAHWIGLAALTISLSIVTAWVALALLICLFIMGWLYQRRALLWSIPLAMSLPVAFLVFSYQYSPIAFAQDFAQTFSRAGSPLFVQFVMASFNYFTFIASSPWLLPGIVGLFLLEPRRVRALVLLIFFVSLFFVLRFSMAAELGFYRVLGLVPFMALGLAALLYRGVPIVVRIVSSDLERLLARWEQISRSTRAVRVIRLVTLPTFLWVVIVDVVFFIILAQFLMVPAQFGTQIDNVLAVPPADAIAAIDYVNANAGPDDVVIASPQVGWAVRARVADFQQTLSYQGFPTENYPTPIEPSRFAFDPTPANARFVVVDRMWRNWGTANITATTYLLDDVSHWQIAFKAGDFIVYRNPTR